MHRLTAISLDHPKATLLVIGCITVFLGLGLPKLRTEFGYRVLIGDDHPTIRTLDHFIAQYGGGLPLLIVWRCGEGSPCESVFDERSLAMADAVGRQLSDEEGVRRVQSPANAPLVVSGASGFESRRLVVEGSPVVDAAALGQRALEDPFWVGTLVSADGLVGAIVVQAIDNQAETGVRLLGSVEAALARFAEEGFEFFLTGEIPVTVIAGRDLSESSSRLIPVMVTVIGLILLVMTRSWREAGVGLATLGLALLWTFGALGWLDWPRDGILEVLAPVILVVGVCDAIHFLDQAGGVLGESPESTAGRALLEAARRVAAPCLITTLTTAGAFLSFATSDLDTFVRFGSIAAFGVVACFVLSFSLLPLLASAVGGLVPRSPRDAEVWRVALLGVARAARKRAGAILLVAGIVLAVCSVGWVTGLRADNFWMESFGDESRAVQATRVVEEYLDGFDTLELEIDLDDSPLQEPTTLEVLDRLGGSLAEIEGLGEATSVVDLLKRANRSLHDDDPAFERIGLTSHANAQLLETIALGDPELLESWISLDRSKVRLSVEAPILSYRSREAGMARVQKRMDAVLPQTWGWLASGEFAVDLQWVRDVQSTQLRSFPTAFALVFLMVAGFLRSWRLGTAAMLPTFLPVVVTLGTMGWLGMSLDVGRAMIAAVVIGIGVDDSIHLLHAYQQRRAAGEGAEDAMRGAILQVGRAVVTTSIALSLGFLTLMASAWQTIASFGLAVSMTILTALVATLFVLPAILILGDELWRDGRDPASLEIGEQQRVGGRCID